MSTIAKAGRVLDLYTPGSPVWGVSEVATALQMPRSTAHSLLAGLTEAGLLHQSRRGRYELGWRAFELGQIHRVTSGGLIETAHPVMQELSRRHSESVCMAVYDRQALIFIDKVVGDDSLSVVGPRIGMRYEPHSFASGRLLMAHLPTAEIQDYIDTSSQRTRSSNAVVRPQVFRDQLVRIRNDQLSYDDGGAILDVGCVAARLIGRHGQTIASLSISAPSRRFRENRVQLSESVRAAAATISRRLREDGQM
ncbi:IclR family transcriptional regulator [Streptomyces sp. NPDC007157]|uniref:IclR family transcriptional regulator n=1 Tax=Streptomyces sp. NPDC007157 TaxID=3154681 RepID=UPI00340DFFFE